MKSTNLFWRNRTLRELRKLRRLSGLTQQELSKRSGIDRAQICLAERNQLRLKSEQRTLLREILLREIHEQRGEIDELLSRPQYQEVLAQ